MALKREDSESESLMNHKANFEYRRLSKISKLLLTVKIHEKVKHEKVRES